MFSPDKTLRATSPPRSAKLCRHQVAPERGEHDCDRFFDYLRVSHIAEPPFANLLHRARRAVLRDRLATEAGDGPGPSEPRPPRFQELGG